MVQPFEAKASSMVQPVPCLNILCLICDFKRKIEGRFEALPHKIMQKLPFLHSNQNTNFSSTMKFFSFVLSWSFLLLPDVVQSEDDCQGRGDTCGGGILANVLPPCCEGLACVDGGIAGFQCIPECFGPTGGPCVDSSNCCEGYSCQCGGGLCLNGVGRTCKLIDGGPEPNPAPGPEPVPAPVPGPAPGSGPAPGPGPVPGPEPGPEPVPGSSCVEVDEFCTPGSDDDCCRGSCKPINGFQFKCLTCKVGGESCILGNSECCSGSCAMDGFFFKCPGGSTPAEPGPAPGSAPEPEPARGPAPGSKPGPKPVPSGGGPFYKGKGGKSSKHDNRDDSHSKKKKSTKKDNKRVSGNGYDTAYRTGRSSYMVGGVRRRRQQDVANMDEQQQQQQQELPHDM